MLCIVYGQSQIMAAIYGVSRGFGEHAAIYWVRTVRRARLWEQAISFVSSLVLRQRVLFCPADESHAI